MTRKPGTEARAETGRGAEPGQGPFGHHRRNLAQPGGVPGDQDARLRRRQPLVADGHDAAQHRAVPGRALGHQGQLRVRLAADRHDRHVRGEPRTD